MQIVGLDAVRQPTTPTAPAPAGHRIGILDRVVAAPPRHRQWPVCCFRGLPRRPLHSHHKRRSTDFATFRGWHPPGFGPSDKVADDPQRRLGISILLRQDKPLECIRDYGGMQQRASVNSFIAADRRGRRCCAEARHGGLRRLLRQKPAGRPAPPPRATTTSARAAGRYGDHLQLADPDQRTP